MNKENNKCQICGCNTDLTIHHLRPQSKCKNKYKQIKDDPTNHILICRQCHDSIHSLFTNNELRDMYDTLDKLMNAPDFAKFVNWRKKHLDFDGHSKMSNRRK